MSFGTFSLADIARQAQDAELRREQIATLRERRTSSEEEAQRAALRERAAMIAKLTDGVQDEATYQQRRQAALAYGMDPGAIPETYDPAFVQTYNTLAHTLLRPDGEKKLTEIGRKLAEAGYQPGTPEFQQRLRQHLDMADTKVVTTTAGGMAGQLTPNGYKPFILPNPGNAPAGAQAEERKTVNGKTYVKRDGQWYEEGAASNGGASF